MRYINDDRYFPVSTTLESERLNKPREKHVQVFQRRFPSSPKDVSSLKVLIVQTLPKILLSEELPVYYGNKYDFEALIGTY